MLFCPRIPGRLGTLSLFALSSLAPALAEAKWELGLSTASYLGQGAESRQENYSSLFTDIDVGTQDPILVSRGHVQGLISFNDSDYRFIEAPQAYLGTGKGLLGPVNLTLGRKLETWSAMDEHWGLGAFQPRFRWDYLSPQQVGLIGLQAQAKYGIVTGTLLYSPLYVPDRGAPLDFANGRINSISPWALNPPYEAIFRGKEAQLRYAAEIPSVGEVVRHHGWAGMIHVGRSTGAFATFSAAYKPMNQLLMAYDPRLKIKNYIDVKIYPRVAYHTLYSTDLGWSEKNWDAYASYLVDLPHDDYSTQVERVSQNVSRMMLVSPTFNYRFQGRSPYSGRLSLSYLKRFGKDLPDTGVNVSGASLDDGTSAFDPRYVYEEAFLVGLRSPQWRKLTADAKFLVDVANPGTILSWMLTYEPQLQWKMYLAADVLTSWSESSPDVGTDFIYRYRANDRVMGGVTYAF